MTDGHVIAPDEIARFAVSPCEHADARTDIGFDPCTVTERKESNRRRERHDSQFQIQNDWSVRLLERPKSVGGRNGVLVEANTEARIEHVPQPDQPLAADRRAVEVADVEVQKRLVLNEHVVAVPCVLGAHLGAADVQIE